MHRIACLLTISAILLCINCESIAYVTTSYSQSKPSAKIFTSSSLSHLLQHNLGQLVQIPQNMDSKELIENFGKNDALTKTMVSYVFAVETDHSTENAPIKTNGCSENNDCFIKEFVMNKNGHNDGYVYTNRPQDIAGVNSKIISLNENRMHLAEKQTNKKYSLRGDLNECVSNVIPKEYQEEMFSLIEKYSNNPSTSSHMKEYLKDVCSVYQLSNMIRKEGKPVTFSFLIKSISNLEKILPQKHLETIHKTWENTIQKFKDNLEKYFDREEIAGLMVSLKNLPKINEVGTEHQFRVLADIKTAQESNGHRQVFIWLPFVLVFVLLFSVLALLNMETEKDTLLYAKFLTCDNAK